VGNLDDIGGNTEIKFKKKEYRGVDWIYLAQDRVQRELAGDVR
jgi:hypothetical protein